MSKPPANEQAKAAKLLDWIDELREAIDTNRLCRVASPRLLVNATAALKAGRSLADVKTRHFQDWSKDERAKAGGVTMKIRPSPYNTKCRACGRAVPKGETCHFGKHEGARCMNCGPHRQPGSRSCQQHPARDH